MLQALSLRRLRAAPTARKKASCESTLTIIQSCTDTSYPPSTTIPRPTETATWDPIHRPTPRPITLSHDESKMYYRPGDDDAAPREDPRKLKVFKAGDEGKEARGVKGAAKAFYRDEL